jgi:phage portal protein BeeE
MVIIDKLKSLFTVKNYSSSSWGKNSYSFFGSWGSFFYSDRKQEEALINEGYISNEDVFAVIKKLVDSASEIPIKLGEIENEEFVPVTDTGNDFLRLIKRPNNTQTQKEYETLLNGKEKLLVSISQLL